MILPFRPKNEDICYQLIEDINKDMKTKIKVLGRIERFNGTDIQQSRHFVKISNRTYIEKILKGKNTSLHASTFPIPMNPDSKHQEANRVYAEAWGARLLGCQRTALL